MNKIIVMMNKIINWPHPWIDKYEAEYTWLGIGIYLGAGIHDFEKGQWAWMLFNFTIMTILIATYKNGLDK
jgi:hypothetical protein